MGDYDGLGEFPRTLWRAYSFHAEERRDGIVDTPIKTIVPSLQDRIARALKRLKTELSGSNPNPDELRLLVRTVDDLFAHPDVSNIPTKTLEGHRRAYGIWSYQAGLILNDGANPPVTYAR